MTEIKPGDVVVLRGGSPKLTVSEVELVSGKPCAFVYWFMESGELKSHYFHIESLKKVDDDNA